MVLSFEQIRSIAGGFLEWEEDDRGLILSPITAKQREFYKNYPLVPKTATRQSYSASVVLDFYTDSEFVSLTVDTLQGPDYGKSQFDFLVNGLPAHQLSCGGPGRNIWPERCIFGPETASLPLPPGENRVSIYLPWGSRARILAMELSDGAVLRPHVCKRTWIAFGDSITQGTGAKFPSMTYANQLARLLDARLYNQGVGGERFRKDKITAGSYPACDFVTIAYGTNDYANWDSARGFEENLTEFFRMASAEFSNVPVFVILPVWREGEETERTQCGTLQQVRGRIREEAGKYPQMTVIDGKGLVPNRPEFYADSPALHPNDLGYSQYAMNLYCAIKDKL